ncbi:hypothetical protein Tco_0064602 [Tanacetum coccineum]
MDTTQAQHKAFDDALVAPDNRLNIRNCNLRLSSTLKSKEPTLQVVLDALNHPSSKHLRSLLIIMDTTQAQHKAFDDALVAPDNRLNIRNCNLRLSSTLKSKEPTLQVVLDALKLTPFFKAFEITADIFPKLPGHKLEDTPFEEEILSFIRDLGHIGEIKCLSGKTTALESLRLSRAQILRGMYHNKHVDYVYLLWEDLVYQVEKKTSKKNNDMYYPRFTNVIVDYFMTKDPSILRETRCFGTLPGMTPCSPQ